MGNRVSIGPHPVAARAAQGLSEVPTFSAQAFVKEKWSDSQWTSAPYLVPLRAVERGIHAQSTAEFKVNYGYLKAEDETTPTVHLPRTDRNWYVCIQVIPSLLPLSPFVPWCGVIPAEQLSIFGTRAVNQQQVIAGVQKLTAQGLSYVLQRRTLHEVPVVQAEQNPGEETEYDKVTALPTFNERDKRGLRIIGNRSAYGFTIPGPPTIPPSYGFGHDLDDNGQPYQWSNWDIIEFLLVWAENWDNFSEGVEPTFRLDYDDDLRTFLDAMHSIVRPGKHALGMIQDLIDRRRGLGASLQWSDDDDGLPTGDVELHLFSLTDVAIVGDTKDPDNPIILPANPIQNDIEIDRDLDVDRAGLEINTARSCDTIVVQGEPMQVVFSAASEVAAPGQSLPLAEDLNIAPLKAGWPEGDETAYKAAKDVERRFERFDRVYRVFEFGGGDDATFQWETTGDPKRYLHPTIDDNGILDANQNAAFANLNTRVLADLPIVHDSDISAESLERRFIKIRAAVELLGSNGEGTGYWIDASEPPEPGSKYPADTTSGSRADDAANVSPLPRGLAVEVHFRKANHSLGRNHFDAGDSPGSSKVISKPPFDWQRMVITACCETELRPSVVIQTGIGQSEGSRKLLIRIPECHLWYVAPGTIKGVNADGSLSFHPGGTVRDDTVLLRLTAALAKVLYGVDRARLKLRRRGMNGALPVGTFVKSVSINARYQEVGSVVSSRFWDFEHAMTTIETGFLELDVRVR